MKTKNIIAVILLVASFALAVVSWLVLPQIVVTQISIGGSSTTTMPKIIAILIPFTLSAGAAGGALLAKENDEAKNKSLIVSAVGIVVFIIMLAVNSAA